MPAATATRPLSTIAPTQQLKPQIQQQGQQQMLQQQHQQPLPQQQMQQQPQQHMQQQLQQQQQTPNLPPLQQRLKPILKQSTANVQPATTAAQIMPVTSQPCVPPVHTPTSTNNNSDVNDDSMKTEDTDVEMQDAQPRWRRKIPGCKYLQINYKLDI